jgi:hypothetical protein
LNNPLSEFQVQKGLTPGSDLTNIATKKLKRALMAGNETSEITNETSTKLGSSNTLTPNRRLLRPGGDACKE